MVNRIASSWRGLGFTLPRAILALAAVALLAAGGFLALSLTPGQTDVASAHGGTPSDHGVTITKSANWPSDNTLKTGQSATYTVVLDDTQVPTEHYTAVEPTLTNTNANFTVSPAIVWFTPSNYETPRTFTVTAKQDYNDNTDGSATITHELSVYTGETQYTRHSLSDDGIINVDEKDISECPTIDIDSAIGNVFEEETYRVTGQRWRWNTDASKWGDRNDCRSWASEGNRSGKWTPARFYMFTIPPNRDLRDVTVTMETENLDAALFLRQNAKNGGILARDANLQYTNGKPVSRVRKNLGPGTYYIEATTPGWNQDWNGSEARPGTFKITVSGLKSDISTSPECDVHSLDGNGAADTYNTWDGSCDSFWVKPYKKHPTRSNARWYKFSVAERGLYTITLKSNEANAWLFLRSGADNKSGAYLVQNNRDVARGVPFKHNFPWDSRIQRWLDPGDYTVEATNWSSGIRPPHVTGPFTLKVRAVKLSAVNSLATSATLSLSGWDTDPVNNDIEDDGPWYYQASAGPDTACSTAQSGTTVTLTGLSPDTAYTYDAYQDAECASLIATTTLRTKSVFVINNDATPVSVTEGGTTNYQVKLRNRPSANVTVTISESTTAPNDDGSITVTSSETLTFTTENWATAQTVTLSAAADTDKLDGSRDIIHTGSSADANYNGATGTLTATEVEDDKGIVFSSGRVSVPEGGEATYTVRLSVAPTGGDTTVTLTEKSDEPDNDPHITVFRPSPPERKLTFTSNNWKTPQTVTLRAAEDPDTTAGTRIIGHVADGGGYSRLTDTVLATEVENDQSIVLSPTNNALSVNEGGSATYTVKLNLAPSANVSVALTAAGDNSITFSPSSLAFTPQNYATAQTVTVSAGQDSDVGNGRKIITHTATSTDANYNNGVASLTVTEQDNDTASATVMLRNAADNANITTLNVTEEDTNGASYKVKLSHQPGDTVTVTLSGNNDGDADITFSPASLTFNTTNYSTAQTVTVSAAADDTDVGNGTKTITHTADGGGYENKSATLTATEQDNDTASAAIKLRNTADDDNIKTLDVTEEDTNGASYKVKLSHKPGADVTVTLAESTTSPNNDTDITVKTPAGKTLTFTPTNYSTAQTVTLQAANDTDEAAGKRDITHTASATGGYSASVTAKLTATEIDNDGTFIIFRNAADNADITAISVPEGTSNTTYKVKLNVLPTQDVTVALTTTGDSDISVSPTSLTFTASTYSTLQTITVTAAEDDADLLNGSTSIKHTATSTDPQYSGKSATLTATEADDDNTGEIVIRNAADSADITGLDVPEGSTATYKVELKKQPRANVTVAISAGSGDSDITIKDTDDSQSGDQTTDITFTPINWSTARTVTLAAASDTGATDGSRTITHTASGTDNGYANVTKNLTAKELDDDKTIILMDSGGNNDISSIIVNEGGTATYKVKLGHLPGGNVTVALAASTDSDSAITLSTASLTFTTDNWETLQTVTLTAGEENTNTVNGVVTVTHTATGGRYNSITAALTVKENDNDNQITPSGEGQAPAGVGSVSASRSGGSIAASWNAPDGATKYHVTYTTDGGSSWSLAASAHDTNSITIANADSGKAYIVGVRAGNDHGWSGWVNSNTVPAQSQQQQPQPANPPASVSGLSASRSGGNITASWNAPDGATKYHVTYTTDGGGSWSLAASAHTSTSISISAANDKAYTVGVRAGNDAGWSGWVNSNEVPKVVTPPASVGSVSATHNGSSVSATWNAPDGATKYHVTYSTDGGASWSLAASEHATNSITIANADSAKTYVVGVRAGNSAGWSGWVNSPPASN